MVECSFQSLAGRIDGVNFLLYRVTPLVHWNVSVGDAVTVDVKSFEMSSARRMPRLLEEENELLPKINFVHVMNSFVAIVNTNCCKP